MGSILAYIVAFCLAIYTAGYLVWQLAIFVIVVEERPLKAKCYREASGSTDSDSTEDVITALRPHGLDDRTGNHATHDHESLPIDKLAAANAHNATECPLFRILPSEILLQFMCDYLDAEDVFVLRRTSRTFMRFFCSRALHRYHAVQEPLFWQPWVAQTMRDIDRKSLRDRIGRFIYRYRGPRDGPPCGQYCAGCGFNHAYFLVSEKEWARDDRYARVCIGHEGYVRICDHKIIRAQDIAWLMGRRKYGLRTAISNLWANGFTPRPPGLYIVCRDQSHTPLHHSCSDSSEARQGDEDEEDSVEVEEDEDDEDKEDMEDMEDMEDTEDKRDKECCVSDAPSFTVECRQRTTATWSYAAHIDLSAYGDRPLTAQMFRDSIADLRKGIVELMAPSGCRAMWPELRCVDPLRCSCLVYPGLQLPEDGSGQRCLRHEATTVFRRRDGAPPDTLHVRLTSCSRGQRCLLVSYRRTFCLENPAGMALYERCESQFGFFKRYLKPSWYRPRIPGGLGLGWYRALDPRSYYYSLVRKEPDGKPVRYGNKFIVCRCDVSSSWTMRQVPKSYPGQPGDELVMKTFPLL